MNLLSVAHDSYCTPKTQQQIPVECQCFCDYTIAMVRPKLKQSKKKNLYVRVRVTKAQREEIMRRWRESGEVTEAAFVRKVLLGKK